MELDGNDLIQAISNQRNAYADESAKFYALSQKLQREVDRLTQQWADREHQSADPTPPELPVS